MNTMAKIVIDGGIPFIHGVLEPDAEVVYLDDIHHGDLTDADIIVIRNRTRCNAELLDGTPVKMIASATIGTDHIDMDYCEEHGIYVQNSHGSNAGGVMNYVFSALYGIAARKSISLTDASVGVIGLGSIGRRVERMATYLGLKTLACDPPRAAREGGSQFVDLKTLLGGSDVVVMCVPLNERSRGMADEAFFARMKTGAVFINAARGEIMVDAALKAARPRLGAIVVDTWNNEPDIDESLLDIVDIATPHIAGYSYQGMQNSTMMAVRAVARYCGINRLYEFFPQAEVAELESVKLDLRGKTQGEVASVLQYNYPIFTDDFMFRVNPGSFDSLRDAYNYRREFYVDY